MNKILMFPLAFMFLLTIFALVYTGGTYVGTTGNYSNQSGVIIDDSERTVEIPNAGPQTFDIKTAALIFVILTVAIAAGILAGIKVLGSGLSEVSQNMIFISIVFLGLWACLSIVSSDFLFENNFLTFFWMSLTTMFVIGVAMHINGSE